MGGDAIDVVGLDADDTLWHNLALFDLTQATFRKLLEPYVDVPSAELDQALEATERRNLALFGYGVKGFTLSMIETALEVTRRRVPGDVIEEILAAGKAMIASPVELLDGVAETVPRLAERHRLLLITKGDLFHQESKLARSGLGEHLDGVEIVSEKDPGTYRRILERRGITPGRFVMVGNSPNSDILPVVAVGARAVHIPFETTWAHEQAELDGVEGVTVLGSFAELPELLASW